ncbi:MAG: hypothetical protein U0361_18950 [Nitrospiraceae bacterium]
MTQLVLARIHEIPGVAQTDTHLVYNLREEKRSDSLPLVANLVAVARPDTCARSARPQNRILWKSSFAAPAEKVKSAVTEVPTKGGYEVDQDDAGNLTTGMRKEIHGPWSGLPYGGDSERERVALRRG